MKFPIHTFVRLSARDWEGHCGCVIGYNERRKFPYEVSLAPEGDIDTLGFMSIQVRENQLKPYDTIWFDHLPEGAVVGHEPGMKQIGFIRIDGVAAAVFAA